jgi:hypothetical protein
VTRGAQIRGFTGCVYESFQKLHYPAAWMERHPQTGQSTRRVLALAIRCQLGLQVVPEASHNFKILPLEEMRLPSDEMDARPHSKTRDSGA